MTPFSDPYFYWQNTVRGDGIKVVTIVKLPNSEFPIVAGDVKEMREEPQEDRVGVVKAWRRL